jgi:serine-type D-Ala-D-Ala carboxypeptidase/endopeptidase (penicillin-binding protein 4)
MRGKRRALLLIAGALAAAAPPQPAPAPAPVQAPLRPPAPLQQRVEAKLAEVGAGTRFGLLVVDESGREIVAVSASGRFVPASTTKMFTTSAAFWKLGPLDVPDAAAGASVRLEGESAGGPDVVLEGHGDARLSSDPACVEDCLAALADAVAAKTRKVRNVVGDDRWFPDERWSPGMSWNNIPTRSGTGVSALTLDDNELRIIVSPGASGAPPTVSGVGAGYYAIDNRALTEASGGESRLGVDRLPGSTSLRLTGTIPAAAKPETLRLGIDDPAHYAAWRLRALLEARGVKVAGAVSARHRPLAPGDDPALRGTASPFRPTEAAALARAVPRPLGEDLTVTSKVSQNLHAELLLRRLGRQDGSGSIADGLAAVRAMLAAASVPRSGFDFSDGSGMSTYNRVSPRAAVTLLRWVALQPWGAAWRSTLPVAGMDGTLANRFKGGPLERRLFAKTGSLNAASGLAGYMVARSGRTLVFAAYANDMPDGVPASKAIDSALELVAAEN